MSQKNKKGSHNNAGNVREIDYEKLAEAIVNAHTKIKEKERNDAEGLVVQGNEDWQSILGITASCWGLKTIQYIWAAIKIPFIPKAKITQDRAITVISKTVIIGIFRMFKLAFSFLVLCCLLAVFNCFDFANWSWKNLFFIFPVILSWVLIGTIRMCIIEIDRMRNQELLLSILSAITSFVAMVLAIIALFV